MSNINMHLIVFCLRQQQFYSPPHTISTHDRLIDNNIKLIHLQVIQKRFQAVTIVVLIISFSLALLFPILLFGID